MSEPVSETAAEPTATTESAQTGEAAQPATDWESEAKKWEKRSKENHAKLKEAEPKLAEYQQILDERKSVEERQAEELTRWQTEAERWRSSAVSSKITSLAGDFADPSDAMSALDPAKYLDAGGEINEAAIKSDLTELLERKPHWRRQDAAPVTPRVPAPNPHQGSGVTGKATADPANQFAAILESHMNGSR